MKGKGKRYRRKRNRIHSFNKVSWPQTKCVALNWQPSFGTLMSRSSGDGSWICNFINIPDGIARTIIGINWRVNFKMTNWLFSITHIGFYKRCTCFLDVIEETNDDNLNYMLTCFYLSSAYARVLKMAFWTTSSFETIRF